MVELLHKRSLTGKHFDIGGGFFNGLCHVGHIHYRTGPLKNGPFDDINTILNYNSVSKSYQMTNASYEAEIGLYGDIRFHNVDHSISFILDNPNKVEATLSDDEWGMRDKGLIWKDIIQKGGHQLVQVRNGSLAKIFHFDEAPKSNTIDFAITIGGNVSFADAINKPTSNKAMVVKSKQTILSSLGGKDIFIRPARAWNHRRDSIDIELSFYLDKDGKLRAVKTIPQDFIDKTFTEAGAWIECDTTTSYYAGAGDGNVFNTGNYGNWVSTLASANGTAANYTDNGAYVWNIHNGGGNYSGHHVFFPIDTSGLTSAANISAATFYNTSTDNGRNYSFARITEGTQASTSTLVVSDYQKFNITQWAADFYSGSPGSAALNTAGKAHINKIGYTKYCFRNSYYDAQGYDVTGDDQELNLSTSESATPPYLSVTYILNSVPSQQLRCRVTTYAIQADKRF